MTRSNGVTGAFSRGEFAALLRRLVGDSVTGRLAITGEVGLSSVWMESGNVRAVMSDLEDEKLGRWLVAQGKLEAHRMALSLLRQPEGVRFGRQLVDEGLLEPEELARELEGLAISIVARLLVSDGTFTLIAEELPLDAATLQMTTSSLLVRAVRTLGAEDVTTYFVPPGRFLVGREDQLGWADGTALSPQEAFLYTRVDGASTLSQLCRLTPLSGDDFLRAAAALVAAGLVEARNEPASLARSPVQDPESREAGDELLEFTPEERREFEEIARLAAELPHLDFYRRLNLTPEATQEQIHTRFRESVRRYHVERAQEPHLRVLRRELEAIQVALQDGFNTLAYVERRARYDELLRRTADSGGKKRAEAAQRRQDAQKELVSANLRRAEELTRTGEFGAAVELLDQAVRFDPQPEALLALAKLEFRNPMWAQRGLNRLRLAVSINPRLTEAWWELGKFWGHRQQVERQLQCLTKVLELDPQHADARRMWDVLKRRGR